MGPVKGYKEVPITSVEKVASHGLKMGWMEKASSSSLPLSPVKMKNFKRDLDSVFSSPCDCSAR